MAGFVELIPDAFSEGFASEVSLRREGGFSSRTVRQEEVRRPVRGLQIKNDTYAQLEVMRADGSSLLLTDGGGKHDQDDGRGGSFRYSNFLLQSVAESREEKSQIVETFGEPYIFFYGERPRIIQCQGTLLNSEDFNWRAEWWENYEKYLRGTKCVQNKTRVLLAWDDIVVQGYFLSASASESSEAPLLVSFSFQLFLTAYENISKIGQTEFPKDGSNDYNPITSALIPTSPLDNRYVTSTDLVRLGNLTSLHEAIKNQIFDTNGSAVGTDAKARFIANVAQIMMGPFAQAGARVASLVAPLPPRAKYGKIRDNVDEYIGLEVPRKPKLIDLHPPLTLSLATVQQVVSKIAIRVDEDERKEKAKEPVFTPKKPSICTQANVDQQVFQKTISNEGKIGKDGVVRAEVSAQSILETRSAAKTTQQVVKS